MNKKGKQMNFMMNILQNLIEAINPPSRANSYRLGGFKLFLQDLFTNTLSQEEWTQINDNPALAKSMRRYFKGIITQGELAREYRKCK